MKHTDYNHWSAIGSLGMFFRSPGEGGGMPGPARCHQESWLSRSEILLTVGAQTAKARVRTDRVKSSPLVPVNVTLFGNRVFAGVIKMYVKLRSYWTKVDLYPI